MSNEKAKASIYDAFAEYKKYTCIRFKKRTYESQYVKFHKGGGWVKQIVKILNENLAFHHLIMKSSSLHKVRLGHSPGSLNF